VFLKITANCNKKKRYKQEKEKEVNQLKALERKRLVEISKLQEGNNRQEAVLRRKNEEISRIQKQLRETFEKQKQVAEKRQMAFDRKDTSSTAEKLRVCTTMLIPMIHTDHSWRVCASLSLVICLAFASNGSSKRSK
jgi:hypothetical protein